MEVIRREAGGVRGEAEMRMYPTCPMACSCIEGAVRTSRTAEDGSAHGIHPIVKEKNEIKTPVKHHRRRTCFVLRSRDVAGMFGGDHRLIEVRYDHERDVVEVVLEDLATGAEWWPGQSAYQVEARPLPTAYVMKGQWPRPA